MTNPYYADPANISSGARTRASSGFETNMDAVEAAFDLVYQQELGAGTITYAAKSGAYTILTTDVGKLFDCTGTFTLDIPVATSMPLGSAFWVANASTGTITLTPVTSTIDGRASIPVYPAEVRLVYRDGSNYSTLVFNPFSMLLTSGTDWTPPTGYAEFDVELIAAGGGGGSGRRGLAASQRDGGGGGSGGAYVRRKIAAAALANPQPYEIGAGGPGGPAVGTASTDGTIGTVGGRTTFGAFLVTQYGRGGGAGTSSGSSGRGAAGAGVFATTVGGGASPNTGDDANEPTVQGASPSGGSGTDGTADVAGYGGNTFIGGGGASGGGGSGLDTANATSLAGKGGGIITTAGFSTPQGGAIGVNGTAGTAGTAGTTATGALLGTAGGGGGSGSSSTGGAGGAGGRGAGGGGGGASVNTSGAGGAGGDGAIRIRGVL